MSNYRCYQCGHDQEVRAAERARIVEELDYPADWTQIRDEYPLPYPKNVDYNHDARWVDFGVDCFDLGYQAAADQTRKGTRK